MNSQHDSTVGDLIALEHDRCSAMVAANHGRLQQLLHRDLVPRP